MILKIWTVTDNVDFREKQADLFFYYYFFYARMLPFNFFSLDRGMIASFLKKSWCEVKQN